MQFVSRGEQFPDVVELYMDPPDNAIVLCVDEKSGIHAVDRTQDSADADPMRFPSGESFDWIRFLNLLCIERRSSHF